MNMSIVVDAILMRAKYRVFQGLEKILSEKMLRKDSGNQHDNRYLNALVCLSLWGHLDLVF